MHQFGFGVEKDYNKALEYYQKGEFYNDSDCLNSIGNLYQKGIGGLNKNLEKALEYYKKAEETNPNAIHSIGFMLMNGFQVEKNEIEGIKKYKEASKKGSSFGLNSLGILYFYGYKDKNGKIKIDKDRGISLFKKAADRGNSFGHANYGNVLLKQTKLTTNEKKIGLRYLKNSIDLGNSLGLHYYAQYLLEQRNSQNEAIEILKKASDNNYHYSQYLLGKIYYYGQGIQENKEEGLKLIIKAASNGYQRALDELKKIEKN